MKNIETIIRALKRCSNRNPRCKSCPYIEYGALCHNHLAEDAYIAICKGWPHEAVYAMKEEDSP